MDKATEYKKYLEALKKATESVKEEKKKPKVQKLSCGGMGAAHKGGKFIGVR